jgi:hypothetical protein
VISSMAVNPEAIIISVALTVYILPVAFFPVGAPSVARPLSVRSTADQRLFLGLAGLAHQPSEGLHLAMRMPRAN